MSVTLSKRQQCNPRANIDTNYLERVVGEVFGAMAARNEPFGAFSGLVLCQMFASDFESALVVAVDGFHGARAHMTLQDDKKEKTVEKWSNIYETHRIQCLTLNTFSGNEVNSGRCRSTYQ
jgi:hypothetical protein